MLSGQAAADDITAGSCWLVRLAACCVGVGVEGGLTAALAAPSRVAVWLSACCAQRGGQQFALQEGCSLWPKCSMACCKPEGGRSRLVSTAMPGVSNPCSMVSCERWGLWQQTQQLLACSACIVGAATEGCVCGECCVVGWVCSNNPIQGVGPMWPHVLP